MPSLERSTRVDLGQCKDKSCYYHSFETRLGVDRGKTQVGHGLLGSTQVDPSQHMDKFFYYHSFKTRLGSSTRGKV